MQIPDLLEDPGLQLWAASYTGLVIGGFLTVLSSRLREHPHTGLIGTLRLLSEPSCCTTCNARVPFLDTIPLIGFVLRRGACRYCGASISWRYPMTEAGTLLTMLILVLPFVGRIEGWLAIGIAALAILALGFAAAVHKMAAPMAVLATLAGFLAARGHDGAFLLLGSAALPAAIWSQWIRALETRSRDRESAAPEAAHP